MLEQVRSRFVRVGGIRTHFLEAGEGPTTVVLLHGGAFGEDAAMSWGPNLPVLGQRYRVVAPDWLGFGGTDKLHDFVSGSDRMLDHLTRFLDVMCIDDAHFGGLSMGGTYLLRVAASARPAWPIRSVFVASGGGFMPANDSREVLQAYDQSLEAMRALVREAYYDPAFAADEDFVRRRHAATLEPGAWEVIAAARFRGPARDAVNAFGGRDPIRYEDIRVPVLYTAGADDRLREPGYADEIAARTPDARVRVFEHCGHVVNVEHPQEWNRLVLEFLEDVDRDRERNRREFEDTP